MSDKQNINKRFDKLENLIISKDKDNASVNELKNLNSRFEKLEKDIEPIIEWFGHINWTKTALLYFAGAVVTVGSAVLTIKSLFK